MIPGVLAKLERASELGQSLMADAEEWSAGHEPQVSRETVADGSVVWFLDEGERPPLSFSVRAGEIVQHIRACFDHTVWALVEANGEEPKRANQYPITTSARVFDTQAKRSLQGVAVGAVEAIRAQQPFPPAGDNSVLLATHAMSNLDKHRLLYASQISTLPGDARIIHWSGLSGMKHVTIERSEGERISGGRRWAFRAAVRDGANVKRDELLGGLELRVDRWEHDVRFDAKYDGLEVGVNLLAVAEMSNAAGAVLSQLDRFLRA